MKEFILSLAWSLGTCLEPACGAETEAGHLLPMHLLPVPPPLAVLLLSGRVGPNTRVWREGFPGPCDDGKSWVPVAALLGVQPKWFTEADAV